MSSGPGRKNLEALRTVVANRGVILAESVTAAFDGFSIGAVDYGVELKAPDGPSTGGGERARQRICLVPQRPGYSVLVLGTIDPVTSTAEVRTFEHLAILHELRFRSPLQIGAQEYEALRSRLEIVFTVSRLRWRDVPPPPELLGERTKQGSTLLLWMVLVLFVLYLALVAFVVFRVMVTRHML